MADQVDQDHVVFLQLIVPILGSIQALDTIFAAENFVSQSVSR